MYFFKYIGYYGRRPRRGIVHLLVLYAGHPGRCSAVLRLLYPPPPSIPHCSPACPLATAWAVLLVGGACRESLYHHSWCCSLSCRLIVRSGTKYCSPARRRAAVVVAPTVVLPAPAPPPAFLTPPPASPPVYCARRLGGGGSYYYYY